MTYFNIEQNTGLDDRIFVNLDNRFDVALIRTGDGLRIEVFPITDGKVWGDPSDTFEVDEEEIRKLERELSDDWPRDPPARRFLLPFGQGAE
jgi:hypothetical protein